MSETFISAARRASRGLASTLTFLLFALGGSTANAAAKQTAAAPAGTAAHKPAPPTAAAHKVAIAASNVAHKNKAVATTATQAKAHTPAAKKAKPKVAEAKKEDVPAVVAYDAPAPNLAPAPDAHPKLTPFEPLTGKIVTQAAAVAPKPVAPSLTPFAPATRNGYTPPVVSHDAPPIPKDPKPSRAHGLRANAGNTAPDAPDTARFWYYPQPTTINIYWYDRSDNEDSFTVERKPEGGTDFVPIASVGGVSGINNFVSYTDTNLAPDTSYSYRIKAVNAYGSSAYTTDSVVGTTVPVPPITISAASVAGTDDQIKVTFTDNSIHEDYFRLFRKGPGDTSFYEVNNTAGAAGTGTVLSITDSGLNSGATYQYYVVASNGAGYSDASSQTSAATNATLTAPGVPQGEYGYANAPNQIRAYMYDRSTNEDSFALEQKSEDETTWQTVQTFPAAFGTGTFMDYYTANTLPNDTAFSYRAKAINSVGESAYNSVMTAATVPVPPITISSAAVAGTDNQISVTFTDNSRHEDYFRLFRKGPADTNFGEVTYLNGTSGTGTTQTFTDTGLTSGTTYQYYVVASNGAGYSSPSDQTSATTNATLALPGAPQGMYGYANGPNQVRAYMYDRATNEDSTILEQSSEDDPTWQTVKSYPAYDATGTFMDYYTDTNLANDTVYSFRGHSHNSVGDSPFNTVLNVATVPVPPITISSAAVAGKDDQISVTFTDNSRHEDYFRLFRKSPTDANFNEVTYLNGTAGTGTTQTFTDTGLDSGTTYQYYVVASNGAGYSAPSDHTTSTTNATLTTPGAPQGMYGYANGRNQARAYMYDRSTNETSFILEQQSEDDPNWQTVQTYPGTAGTGSFMDYYSPTTLADDTAYYYRAKANNSFGDSPYNTVLTVYTVPVPPINVAAVPVNDTKIKITWNDNSRHEDYFRIFRKGPADANYNEINNVGGQAGTGTAMTFTDSGLTPETSYSYLVEASNSAGYSTASNTADATTNPSNPPGAPSNLIATPTQTDVVLRWLDNGTSEQNFVVERQSESESSFTQVGTAPASPGTNVYVYYTDPALASDTTFTYRVKAHNAAGDSAYSGTAIATTAPATPTSVTANAVAGTSDQIKLTWTDTSKHEDGFYVYRKAPTDTGFKNIGFVASVAGTGSTVTYTNIGLQTTTAYTYYVTAYNGAGESTASSQVTATTNSNDAVAPNTFILTGPDATNPVCNADVTFTFTGSDNVTAVANLKYQYRLDGGAYSTPATTTSATFPGLADGSHTFEVAAVDEAGNVDASPATRTFTVSVGAPVLSAIAVGSVNETSATVTWTTDKPATSAVDYRKQGTSTWTTISDTGLVTSHSISLIGLAQGTAYEYQVRSADSCGHSTTSAVANFSTLGDTVAPDTSITGGTGNVGNLCGSSATFTFTGSDNVTTVANLKYQYRIDGGAWSAPASTTTASFTGLADGSHTFDVAAIDQVGNVDASPASHTFTVDVSGPVISAVSVAHNTPISVTITWGTDKAANSAVDYRVQGTSTWTTVSDGSMVTSHSLAIGGLTQNTTYEYKIRSSDGCSNETSSTSTFSTSSDVTGPTTSITAGPADNSVVCGTSTSFTYTGSDDVTAVANLKFRYKVDSGSWSAASTATSASLTGLTEGAHTFSVAAVDEAGNADSNPPVRHFTVSLTAPNVLGVHVENLAAASATVKWVTDKPATSLLDYRVQGTSTWTTTTPDPSLVLQHAVSLTGLLVNTIYEYRVHSSDACGNETVSAVSTFTTTLDSTAPGVSLTGGPTNGGKSCSQDVVFTWTGSDNATPVDQLTYSFEADGGAWSAYSTSTTTTVHLSVGTHTFAVRSKDASGNVSPTPASVAFAVVLDAPTILTLTSTPKDYKAVIDWSTSTATTGKVDYGTSGSYGKSVSDTVFDGAHSVEITGLLPLTTYHYRVTSNDGCRDVVSADQTFTTSAVLPPNLWVTKVSFPATATSFDNINVSWTIQNSGPGDTHATWKDSLYISSTGAIDATAKLLGKFAAPLQIEQGQSYSQTQQVQIPRLTSGSYYIIVKADGDNVIAEQNETDNATANPIAILKVQDLIAAPDQLFIKLNPTVAYATDIDLLNFSEGSLNRVAAIVSNVPSNVTVKVTVPSTIASLASVKAHVVITAADESVLTGAPVITFASGEGPSTTATLNLQVIPRVASLVASPASITAGMVRGQQTLVQFDVTNTGSAVANNVTVTLPGASWMSLSSPVHLGALGLNEKATVVISLNPAIDLPLGPYRGAIAVSADNTTATVPFTFNCVSDQKGDVSVLAQDEFSFFAADHPNVSGATVNIVDPQTGTVLATGLTGDDGKFSAPGLFEGTYNVQVSAPLHSSYQGVVQVVAGQTQQVNAFLARTLVTYTWSVVPVDTVDQYQISIDATFETNVPAPVVTIAPKLIALNQIQFDTRGHATIYYTITNHGLVAADNGKLTFPTDPNYSFVPTLPTIGKIPALTTLIVPVTVTNLAVAGMARPAGVKPRSGGGCEITGTLDYSYFCGGDQNRSDTVSISSDCPTVYVPADPGYYNPGGFGPGGGGTGPTGGGTYIYDPSPPVITFDFCDPCDTALLKNIAECIISLIPGLSCGLTSVINGAECADAVFNSGAQSAVINCTSAAASITLACAKDVGGKAIGLGYVLSLIVCAYNIATACDGLPGHSGITAVKSHAGGVVVINPTDRESVKLLKTNIQRLQAIADAYTVFYGDSKWLNGQKGENDIVSNWFSEYKDAMAAGGDGGAHITTAERAHLHAIPHPSQVNDTDIDTLIDRWNRTLDYYAAGIKTAAQVPAGQSTDFIDAAVLQTKFAAAREAAQANMADGVTGIFDGVVNAEQNIKDEILHPKDAGICAKVRVHLDQKVAITRTAFQATLELTNAPENVQLQNVKVDLKITDVNGVDSNAKFGIGNPTLTNFSDVSGGGSLDPGITGTAVWKLLPTRDAAPDGDTVYFVGGTITYTQNGVEVKIPLLPTGITVKPDPLLQFHYFWQRDVVGDDPFTPQVEPAEPFSLGLIVANKGKGTARNMTITSSQPKIVDNQKGLLIAFKLVGTKLNKDNISPSLQLDFGDILPDTTATAQFLMTSTLMGKFEDFSASYTHVDDLGNARTSIIDSVDIHELDHVVRIDTPDDDGRPDFLANDVPDINDAPDHLWDSNGGTYPVTPVLDATTDGPVTPSHLTITLTSSSTPTGWVYFRVTDPSMRNYTLQKVVRSDGRVISLDDNAWTTHRVKHLDGGATEVTDNLHIIDKDTTGSYTLIYGGNPPAVGPVGSLKQLADGSPVTFGDDPSASGSGGSGGASGGSKPGAGALGDSSGVPAVVTADFGSYMYIESFDRSSGIRVTPGGYAVNTLVAGSGVVKTAPNGERYIESSSLKATGLGSVESLHIQTKPLWSGDYLYNAATGAGQKGFAGGAGLTTVGLLVSTIGQVASTGPTSFTIDDGYGKPVRVPVPSGGRAPGLGEFVGVVGVVSIDNGGGILTPVILPRGPADVVPATNLLRQTAMAPATTITIGDNLFGIPGIPATPDPAVILNPVVGLQGLKYLNRYDAPTQAEVFWDSTQVPNPFGNMLMGEGYRLTVIRLGRSRLTADLFRSDFADTWISLPILGATRWADPYLYDVDWSSVLVTDGTTTLTLADAAKNQVPGWLNSKAQYFDNSTQKMKILGLPEDTPDSTAIQAWRGYWTSSMKDNVALIIPSKVHLIGNSDVQVTATPVTFNAGANRYQTNITLKNVSGKTINGPIDVVFMTLGNGIAVDHPTSYVGTKPYISPRAATLSPGKSTTITVSFINPSNGPVNYTAAVYSGQL